MRVYVISCVLIYNSSCYRSIDVTKVEKVFDMLKLTCVNLLALGSAADIDFNVKPWTGLCQYRSNMIREKIVTT